MDFCPYLADRTRLQGWYPRRLSVWSLPPVRSLYYVSHNNHNCIFCKILRLGHHHYHVAICYGLNNDEYMMFKSRLSESVLGQGEVIEVELGAALGIHSGPELFGMAVYILPET